jgi:nucleotide-binding universal stress UspA family protein
MTIEFADFSAAHRKSRVRSLHFAVRSRGRTVQAPARAPAVGGPLAAASVGARAQRILIPVTDARRSIAAVSHVVRETLHGERIEVDLLWLRSPFALSARWRLPGRERAAFDGRRAEIALRASRDLLNAFHVPYAVHVRDSHGARAIVAAARQLAVDRIVIGAARERSLLRLIQDATIDKIADFAAVPVDVVVNTSLSRLERIGLPAALGAALGALAVRLAD